MFDDFQFCDIIGPAAVLNLKSEIAGQIMTDTCKEVFEYYPDEHFVSDCKEFYGECLEQGNEATSVDCDTCKSNAITNINIVSQDHLLSGKSHFLTIGITIPYFLIDYQKPFGP